jgi:hypothetical protein
MSLTAKYFRVAFSAVCGIAAVLVVILWVLSYRHSRAVLLPGIASCPEIGISSSEGQICLFEPYGGDWWRRNRRLAVFEPGQGYRVHGYVGHFDGGGNPMRPGVRPHEFRVPYWSAVLMLVSMSAVPWMRWRFSVRTLLIGMTLVAVILGIAMWAAHR